MNRRRVLMAVIIAIVIVTPIAVAIACAEGREPAHPEPSSEAETGYPPASTTSAYPPAPMSTPPAAPTHAAAYPAAAPTPTLPPTHESAYPPVATPTPPRTFAYPPPFKSGYPPASTPASDVGRLVSTDREGNGASQSTHSTRFYLPLFVYQPLRHVYVPILVNRRPTATSTPTPAPTSTPAPTATPTPPWPEPLEEPGDSKLGLHVEWNNSPDIMEFVRRTKPAVVKAAGDLGFLAEVKAVSPWTVTVARLPQEPQKLEGDPIQAARHFVNKNLEEYRLNPAVDYWEGWNEPGVNVDNLGWYAAFEAERARLMAEHGFHVAVGAFSAGVPEWDAFGEFLPAIAAAQKYDGIFTVHEYDAPTLDRSVGAGLPGRPAQPDRGALALRYRWWYEDFLKPRGLVVPLVVSEAGIDGQISNRPGPSGLGWQDFQSYWETHGVGDNSVKGYIEQLAWYDHELRQDDYVIGFAVFTAGVLTDRWKSFDVTPYLREIAEYVVSQQ